METMVYADGVSRLRQWLVTMTLMNILSLSPEMQQRLLNYYSFKKDKKDGDLQTIHMHDLER